ncbi:hypothetical protein DDD_0807 [Nonlabens dokdonensis DSW-6]|uniref:Uncharacterized protein n=1 Tax=Nonlabens dokdonensis (strain DSM 17205 / KCTC 12402 / DSW-6) TaxID=592029 RepID=L7W734_NONDD|nr:hypothetical protein DDD_0807 [Nonlabens dokdonensis DSW-6]
MKIRIKKWFLCDLAFAKAKLKPSSILFLNFTTRKSCNKLYLSLIQNNYICGLELLYDARSHQRRQI